jgi:hypothetical protein
MPKHFDEKEREIPSGPVAEVAGIKLQGHLQVAVV